MNLNGNNVQICIILKTQTRRQMNDEYCIHVFYAINMR